METLTVQTKKKYELVDLTEQLAALVEKTLNKSGIVLVFVPHTTATLICNEAEANLKSDILKLAKALEENAEFFGGFAHDYQEGNAHAHLVSAFAGNSRTLIIEDGQLKLGAWQSIMLLEMDGPRERQVWIKIISSS
ncbi:MAG: YjbQ family protein [Candidatus Doudnabacteria bacterium]|nr:YjbQ family protein [Candidatus Doudnabacteria bacterium]